MGPYKISNFVQAKFIFFFFGRVKIHRLPGRDHRQKKNFISKKKQVGKDFFLLQNFEIQDLIFQKKPFLKIRK